LLLLLLLPPPPPPPLQLRMAQHCKSHVIRCTPRLDVTSPAFTTRMEIRQTANAEARRDFHVAASR
jgi:hypothetical protein